MYKSSAQSKVEHLDTRALYMHQQPEPIDPDEEQPPPKAPPREQPILPPDEVPERPAPIPPVREPGNPDLPGHIISRGAPMSTSNHVSYIH